MERGRRSEYAIAGTWAEFWAWTQAHPEKRHVHYLTKARAELYVRRGMPKGILHRIGRWETSPARVAAEELEALES